MQYVPIFQLIFTQVTNTTRWFSACYLDILSFRPDTIYSHQAIYQISKVQSTVLFLNKNKEMNSTVRCTSNKVSIHLATESTVLCTSDSVKLAQLTK